MKKKLVVTFLCCLTIISTQAQETWSLQRCISYAENHSTDIRQAALQRDSREVALRQSKWSTLPSLNIGANQQFSFGRATGIDNVIVNRSQSMTNMNISAEMPLFTGLRITNRVRADRLNLAAATADLEAARKDLTLNIMAAYLQVLYTQTLIAIAEQQVALSEALVERTERLVASGKTKQSELFDNRAQLATDRQKCTEAQNNLRTAQLDLCQLMNYSEFDSLRLEPLNADALMATAQMELISPDTAYNYALSIYPTIRAQKLRLESARREVSVAQSGYWPQLSFIANYGTGYYYLKNAANTPFGEQFRNNGSTLLGFSLSVPIFNRLSTKTTVQQAKIGVLGQGIALERTQQTLRKQIQTAYVNATAARDRYTAAHSTVEASQLAFTYAQKSYDAGKSTSYEYETAKTRLHQAKVEVAQAQFEFILRTKIFNFYNGIPLRL